MTPTTPLYPVKVQDAIEKGLLTTGPFTFVFSNGRTECHDYVHGQNVIWRNDGFEPLSIFSSVLLPKPEAAEISEGINGILDGIHTDAKRLMYSPSEEQQMLSFRDIMDHIKKLRSLSLPSSKPMEISEEEVQEKIKQSIIDAFNSGKREESHSINAIENTKTGEQFYLEGEHYYKTLSLPSSNRQTEAVEDAFVDRLLAEFKRQGINTENWDGDEGPEKAIVDGVKSLLKEQEDYIKNLHNGTEH